MTGYRTTLSMMGLTFLIAFTGAVTPGPMLALVMGQVLAHGLPAVVMILIGHALIEGLFILGFSYGLARILERGKVRGILALVGGAMVGWLGLDIVLHASRMVLSGASRGGDVSLMLLIPAGIGVSLSNPYFTGWWATVGSGQVAAFGIRGGRQYGAFWFAHEMGDAVWYVFVSVLLLVGRRWLSDGVYQILLAFCGWVMCALALIFIFAGLLLLGRRPVAETVT